MKPNKGFITVFMMVLISISLSTFSRAAFDTFSDVPNDSPFHESIFYLAERGIVRGEGNGRYVPDAPVTVRQWAMMLCRALGNDDPLNYDDDCIRRGYSDGWLEMTAITAPDSDLCRYAMDELGFDDEARQWAGALYETLEESDAINKYKSYYEAYQPGYGGDGSYSGDVEYGSGYDNKIDISGFVDPSTKNNLDLAAYAIQAWTNNWGYVWGTYGNVLTPALFEYKKQQYPDGVGNYADFIKDHWLGRRTADCIGLIKGYGWLDTKSMTIRYATNGMPDYGADQMYHACKNAGTLNKDYGTVSTMPEIPGLMLWKSGHAGVYIGGGYAIEAMGTSKGVVKTKVSDRNWQGWGKLPYIDYREGN